MINKKNQKGEALKKRRAHIHITSTMPSAEIRHKVSRKNHSGKFRILAAENGSMPDDKGVKVLAELRDYYFGRINILIKTPNVHDDSILDFSNFDLTMRF